MAAVLTSTQLTALQALTVLEEQFAYVAQALAAAQETYNAAHTDAKKNAISIVPNFTTGSITIQAVLPLDGGAVTNFPSTSVGEAFGTSSAN